MAKNMGPYKKVGDFVVGPKKYRAEAAGNVGDMLARDLNVAFAVGVEKGRKIERKEIADAVSLGKTINALMDHAAKAHPEHAAECAAVKAKNAAFDEKLLGGR